MRIKAVHYVPCFCAGDDCDCQPYCHVYSDEIESTGRQIYVTCKRCLSALAARKKRVEEGRQPEWLY
jgi:hypothetical protein